MFFFLIRETDKFSFYEVYYHFVFDLIIKFVSVFLLLLF